MNYRLGWTQLDGYINGSRRIQSKKKKGRIGPIAYTDVDLKARYLYNTARTMPVSKWEPFLPGHLNLEVSLPLF